MNMPSTREQQLQVQMRDIVCYLWDNYLQLYDAENIFLLGVGNAYLGVKMLLISRGELSSCSSTKDPSNVQASC